MRSSRHCKGRLGRTRLSPGLSGSRAEVTAVPVPMYPARDLGKQGNLLWRFSAQGKQTWLQVLCTTVHLMRTMLE